VTELTIAIAKGRLQAETLDLLTSAGLVFSDQALSSRRLAIEDESGRFRFVASGWKCPGHRQFGAAERRPHQCRGLLRRWRRGDELMLKPSRYCGE